MPEVIITYKNAKTLEALKDFSKYFDYSISAPKKKAVPKKSIASDEKNNDYFMVYGVTIMKRDKSINTDGLEKVFTGKHIDAKELRRKAWQRKK